MYVVHHKLACNNDRQLRTNTTWTIVDNKLTINIKFTYIIILEQIPCTKTQRISSKHFWLMLTNISLALLCHGKPINCFKL